MIRIEKKAGTPELTADEFVNIFCDNNPSEEVVQIFYKIFDELQHRLPSGFKIRGKINE